MAQTRTIDQTPVDWLMRDGRPLPVNTGGTGIFLFPDGAGVAPRKQFLPALTYAECVNFAQSRGVQAFKWVPKHIADLPALQAMPCGKPCNRFSGCDGGCICNEDTGFCE